MQRLTRDLLLVLLGGVAVRVAWGEEHLAYVRPGFGPLLLVAGAVVFLLGVAGVLTAPGRDDDAAGEQQDAGPSVGGHGAGAHGHGDAGPRIGWLLLLPVAVLVVVAPPALGAYTAARQAAPPAPPAAAGSRIAPDDPGTDHVTLPLLSYWFASQEQGTLDGRIVRLVGFVTPREGGGWYVSRIRISCCAADAAAISVVVDAPRGDLPADQWVEVVGTAADPVPDPTGRFLEPVVRAVSVTRVPEPVPAYEG
ncbi:TIGR03943 family protein [Modestobacter sp. I12A-02628]|uniref:TIGR03943 family protein n=1 Tax=Goekera deserti TaxID=2497753 RepID=A0A7K3WDR4_9ACTN|nr:TIGR03943 family protein [Goekera deserti]MPQ97160.1 TIGR03943 family protein [Goekera deserti]NDI46522.1 TIGR03943 family protein [Goekera deserti]NEL54544.1 TIGR03943 family protein [Goekera deserti]